MAPLKTANTLHDGAGRILDPGAVVGLLTGMAVMFATGLLVTA